MSNTILQINYKFTITRTDYVVMATPVAEPIAATLGLIWKFWLMNEAEQEAGGIYLFENRDAAQAFLNGPIVAGLGSNPAIHSVSTKLFDVEELLSRVTHAPLPMNISLQSEA